MRPELSAAHIPRMEHVILDDGTVVTFEQLALVDLPPSAPRRRERTKQNGDTKPRSGFEQLSFDFSDDEAAESTAA